MEALGSHDPVEIEALGHRYLHFLLGLNPLNMVYLTNMAAYGGEHSSFQIYHGWFSYTGGDGDNGNATTNGKPAEFEEPLYPYYPDDNQLSVVGPAPGLVSHFSHNSPKAPIVALGETQRVAMYRPPSQRLV